MHHPWVTDDGRVPLYSAADMGLGNIEVTAQEQQGAIDRGSVVSMIRARLKEKAFRHREYLFKAVRAALLRHTCLCAPACLSVYVHAQCLTVLIPKYKSHDMARTGISFLLLL
jgi:hypothetical protein